MASRALPKAPACDELTWATLKALKAMGGSASNEELLAKVIDLENIPEDVQTFLHTDHNQAKRAYNLAWAKTCLMRVRAIENSPHGALSEKPKRSNLRVRHRLVREMSGGSRLPLAPLKREMLMRAGGGF